MTLYRGWNYIWENNNYLPLQINKQLKHAQQEQVNNNIPNISRFWNGSTALIGQGFLIVEVLRWHSDTPHSVGLFWTSYRPSQQPLPDNTQHSKKMWISLLGVWWCSPHAIQLQGRDQLGSKKNTCLYTKI